MNHRCFGGSCVALGCARSWSWKAEEKPKLDSVKEVLRIWVAFRNKPSRLARCRQTKTFATLTKQEAFKNAFCDVVRLVEPWRFTTIICDWDEHQLAETYDKATTYLGGTMLTTKTLYFLVPDLFLILDRQHSYPPLRKEMRLLRQIDRLDGRQYASMMSHVRNEVATLIKQKGIVRLKGGLIRKVTNISDFRSLSPRSDQMGTGRPGTICKVIDDIFAG